MASSKRKLKRSPLDQHAIANPERSINVSGEITRAMVAELTPRILRLKAQSSDAITVIIDSPGGLSDGADILCGLLKAPDQHGGRTRMISVVTGQAYSAAARLLSVADYAVAYKHSRLHFHGVYSDHEHVTAEEASDLTQFLLRVNSSAAFELAEASFGRFIDLYSRLLPEFSLTQKSFRKELSTTYKHVEALSFDVPAFALTLAQKVSAPTASMICEALHEFAGFWSAMNMTADLAKMLDSKAIFKSVRRAMRNGSRSGLGQQLRILLSICIQRLRDNSEWDLASEDFNDLRRDFDFIALTSSRVFEAEILNSFADYQHLFMSADDIRYFMSFEPDALDRNAKLRARYDRAVRKAYDEVKPLWAFMVTLQTTRWRESYHADGCMVAWAYRRGSWQ